MSFLDFPGLQYFYNKYLKPIKPHAREETIKSYTVNEQGHVPDAQLVAQLKEENESLQAKVEALNSALTAIIGGLPSSSGGRVEFIAHEYPAGEFWVDGEKSTHNCSIAYMRLYFTNDRSILIGAMFGTSDPDWWSKYVATTKILVSKNIDSKYFGWTSI